MALEFASKLAGYVVGPIGREISYVKSYESNVENFKEQVKLLEGARERVQRSVDEAKRNGEEIYEYVDKWLNSVTEITKEAGEFIVEDDKAMTGWGCLNGLCPNLKSCSQLSKKAEKITEAVVNLNRKGTEITKKAGEFIVEDDKAMTGCLNGLCPNLKSRSQLSKKAEKITAAVVNLNGKGTEITEEAGEFIVEDEDKATTGCLNGLCPNLKSRYQLSKKAEKIMEAVVNLKGKGEFPSVSYRVPSPGIWFTSIEGYMALESRMPALKEIMEALTSSNLSLIGVYGMGGVGKTTLVEQVARKAEKDKLFDQVVMATVKEPPNVKEIQQRIADKLGLKFGEENEDERRDRLWDRLQKEKKVLVILDNVCTALDLKEIGVPFGDDHEGCKILLTSRYQDVLSREMGTRKDFRVEILLEDEAWSLFEKTVGDVVNDAKVRPVAIEVAKRCLGLPVLIVPVGKALRNGSLYDWKDALKKLERFDNEEEMNAKVFSALELSYNHLKDKEVKSLFLLCGQLRHDSISIQGLLEYSLGLGIFKNISNLDEARNRVHKLVNDLKAACLLLEGESPRRVKMHDFVHDFALSIASRDHHVFSVDRNNELKEWPPKDKLEQCMAISFPYPRLIHELPEELQCPKVESFFLFSRDPSLKIPENFFKRMKKLKVLDLTKVHLLPLPSSLQYLENLRTLCLDFCVLGDIAALGELKKLEILSLIASNIVQLPTEIGKLTRLLLLDLSRCSKLEVISPGVLSSLSRLEDLYMGENSFVQWEIEELNSRRSNASLTELMTLPNLISLDIHIPDAKILPKEFFSNRLERYHILIGDELDWSGMNRTSRMLKLKLHISSHMKYGFKMLKETEDLHLHELKGVKNVLFDLDGEGFPLLKHLSVQNGPEILYIVNSEGRLSCNAFPILESLILDKLIYLEKICHGQLTAGSFAKLRSIKVESCHKLRYLFSISLASGLRQLQEIEVTECEIMEEIVADRREDDANYNAAIAKIEFTRLRSLTLKHLPRLTRFSSISKMPSASQRGQRLLTSDTRSKEIVSEGELTTPTPLFNEKVVFPNLEDLKLFSIDIEKIWDDQLLAMSFHFQNLTRLIVDGCGSLKYLFSTSMVESFVKLQNLEICNCKFMERVIVTEEGMIKMQFAKLVRLKLKNLPKLRGFCSQNFIEFPALSTLWVENCPDLKTFISNSICTGIMESKELEELKPEENLDADKQAFFDDKVGLPSLKTLVIWTMINVKKIWHDQLASDSFCKLITLNIHNCENLVNIFPSNMLERLQRLEVLIVTNSGSLEELFEHQGPHVRKTHAVTAPQLRKLFLRTLPNLKHVWNEDIQEILAFQNLHSIEVIGCQRLEHLFPAFVARGLLQLEVLEITSCRMKEIVAKEKEVEAATSFVFPQVTSMKLWKLPELKCFYHGLHTSEWPMLKKLVVYSCGKVECLASNLSSFQQTHGESQHDIPVQQSLFLVEKVAFPNLEELRLEWNNMMKEIWHGQFSAKYLSKLKVLELICFPRESVIFPSCFLQGLPNLQKLLVSDAHFKEIFLCEGFTRGEQKHVVTHIRLSELKLSKLPELMYLWKETFQPSPVFQNLETLEVSDCGKLKNLMPASISFQNLTTLMVSKCHKLIHLVTPSTARSLVQLTKMSIIECEMIEEIVANKGEETQDEITFSRLKHMELHFLPRLISFSSGNYTFEFPSLEEVIVRQCPKMKIFSIGNPSAPMLQEIQVAADERHWELNLNTTIQWLSTEMDGFRFLEYLNLSEVPEMQEIWPPQDPARIKHLKSLVVDKCAFLLNAIPSNLLQFLNNLEELDVRSCDLLEEIFDLEGLNADEGNLALLSKLSKFSLSDLPQLRHVWNEDGQRILCLKNLKVLKVYNCSSLRNVCALSLASSLVQLQEMEVKNCPMIEKIMTTEVEEAEMDKIVFPQLGSIILESLPSLTSFYSGTSILECPSLKIISIIDCPNMKTFTITSLREQEPKMAGEGDEQRFGKGMLDSTIVPFFNEKVLSPNVQDLKLFSIDIEKIWDDQLLAMSFQFQNLTRLIVDGCGSLKYFFSTIMVESLVKLQNLEICNCKFMERVIVTEEEGMIKMQFPKLVQLKLKNLPKLRGFCSQNFIEFPALSTLWVENCPDLKTFISNSICTGIMESKELEEMKPEENLNANKQAFFDDKVRLLDLKTLVIWSMNKLKKIWHDQLASDSFCKLITLNIRNCENLVNIFPSNMLERLQRLEVLIVTNSGSLEELFEHQGPHVRKTHAVAAPELRKLFLRTLPNLKHVWNKDIQEILAFQNLHSIEVIGCQKLEHLFPAFVARRLLQLEVLEITSCRMKEIVAKEKGVEVDTSFVFPRVTSMKLWKLPELKCFYPGIHTSKWPTLKKLVVYGCDKVKNFASKFLSFQETHGESQHDIPVQQSLFLVGKDAFPNLEELRLEWNDIMKEIWHGQFSVEYFSKLKVLELICFPQKSVIFPSCFLQGLPNLEKLLVSDAPFKEIFLCEGITDGEETHVLTHIRLGELKLSKLPELMYLWKETFQPGPVFQNLETLEVSDCGKLKNLVPSSISFQNLTALIVSKCHGLIHLVTPSTAKSLVQLTKMSIIECDMIEEIIANRGEETQDEIAFSRLKHMKLHFLPRLISFSSGNHNFEFPSLEEVIVRQCPKMKIFSVGNSSAPMLQGIQVAADEQHWELNLNTTIQWLSTEMDGFRFLEYLNLSEVPEMQEIWPPQDPARIRHLKSLVVDKCAFLLNAIPSNVLRFLNNLEELDVRSCDLLEEVFDLEGLNVDEGYLALLSKLSKFSLSDLPRLRHIWNEDGQIISSLKNLKVLRVHNCSSLRNVCALSLASTLVQLEEMEVKNCPMIEKIMATEVEEAEIDKIVFPQLGSIILESLPNLTSFYSGTSMLECPSLNKITIIDCPNMKTFTTTSIREQEPKMVGEGDEQRIGKGDLDTIIAPFFNAKVVFLNLEDLKLFSINTENVWDDQLLATSFHFQNLTDLIVDGCGSLKYLFSTSMVGSLVKLQNLKICNCKFMEDVIVTEEDGMIKMWFPNLETLELKDLPKLTRFCSENFIEFPTLHELRVENCPDLEAFISNPICTDIMASEEHEEMKPEENLDADKHAFFDDKVGLPSLKTLAIWRMNNMKKIWHDQLTTDSFCKLDSLDIYDCENLVKIFPSNMLERLQRLVELSVDNCGSLEELFEHEGPHVRKTHAVAAPELRKLYLDDLPKLKHVWNDGIQEILAFQNLCSIEVISCQSLEHLFPAFVARRLLQLEVLEITSCRMKEIVAKEKGVEGDTSFVFPRVTSMKLWKLPELKCFYPRIHTSKWPMLKKLVVYGCDKVENFASKFSSFQETHGESQHDIPVQQSLFLVGKDAFPNLEELRLEWNDIMKEIWHGQFSVEYFSELKVLELICFPQKSVIFPSCFLQGLPNLEKLLVSDAPFKEIFLCEGITDGEETHVLTHIRLGELKLSKLPELMYLWKETFQPGPVFQNLETLEVSDCGKLKDLVPSSISFQNLTALIVSKCHGLIHLVTPSTAKSLVQLTKMSIIECDMIEEIVANMGEETQDEIAFSRLKHMELHFLPRLTSFSSGNCNFEFPSLEEVIVRQCPKMKIFSVGNSSAPMLQGIQVAADEQHWELNLNTTIQWLSIEMDGFRFLEYLNLSEVPEMQEIWPPQDPARISYLRSLVVDKCAFLLNAIPSNVLRFLNNLEELDVRSCDLLEEVFDLEGLNADEGNLALLSKLSKFSLSDLPRLRHIWNEDGQIILGLKNLKVLRVHNCSSLRNVCALSLASTLVQLEEMEVKNCPMIEKIMTTEVEEAEIDKIVFPQLGSIILESLPNFTSFYSGTGMLECPSLNEITIIDCPNMKTFTATSIREQEPKMASEGDEQRIGKGELDITIAPFFNARVVFLNLEDLKLFSINTENVWDDQLLATSFHFQNLTDLIVDGCGSLKYLFSTSMVGSLVKLQNLKICNCKFMEDVIVTEEDGMIKMWFPNLETLELKDLPKLTRFCSENFIEFPTLHELRVENCPDLEAFISNPICTDIMASEEHEEMKPEENLDADKHAFFDDKVGLPSLKTLAIWRMNNMKKIWHDQLTTDSFCKLDSLDIYDCENLVKIFPSNMLERLQRLVELSVDNCGSLEELFEHEGPHVRKTHAVAAPELKKLYLDDLPKLKHVWNDGIQEILAFQNLCSIEVISCQSLEHLFPAFVARRLLQLEVLEITSCRMKEIVAKEKGVEGDTSFVFPRVTSMKLWKLPELKCFYPRIHTSKWPMLKKLVVYGCDKVENFASKFSSFQETHGESQHDIPVQQSLFLVGKDAFPNLEELRLEWNDIMKEIWHGQFSVEYFSELKVLELICFPQKSVIFPSCFLQGLPNLEKLLVSDAPFKEIFLCEGITDGEETHVLTHIRLGELKLSKLPELMYLWKETFQPGPVFQNLETLEVSDCGKLKDLVPSSISFQNLTALIVSKCHGLIHLVTPSTAKSLVQLTKMSIIECDMIEEIVANMGEETQDEIAFSRLKHMELHFLPRLTSFSSGNYNFEFPSLEEVIVRQCPKMKIFSVGNSSAPMLQGIQVAADEQHWELNLNTTIQWLYIEMDGFRFLEYLNLSEVPEMQEIWPPQDPARISYLRSLVVDKCAFLLNAIPSNVLRFLNNLEELDVRSCDLLEEVFDLEGLNADEGNLALLSKLSKFSLSDLPRLRHIWNEDGQIILGLQNLKVLRVHNCSSLRNVCALSLASTLVQLEEMEVKNCPMIEKIMTTEVEEAEIDKIVFPQLGSIILESLPNLTSFYSGTGMLECPSLNEITIIDCPNMKTFTTTSMREQEPKMAGEGDEQRIGKGELDITIAPFFNEKALLPNLETLELCSVNIEKIWDDQLLAISYCIQNLTSLTVKDCWSLRYVFTSCMVKSLEQLENLEIRECKIMEEIIVTEGSQEGWMNKMLFPNLEGLVLEALPKLTRFCTANFIEFLVLKELSIDNCPELKSFISNSTSAYIMAGSEPEEMNLEEKLNTDILPLFDEKVVLPNLEILLISHMKNLKKIWHDKLAANSFCKLYDFRVDFCGKLLNIFRSNMLRRVQRLEILIVSDCDLIEEVFELQDQDASKTHVVTATSLRELYLANLPNLKHVWNKDPIGISCGEEETVAKEKDVEAAISLVFPQVISLELRKLPELKSFYPGIHISEWPLLKKLVVYGCDIVGIFSMRSPCFQETHEESQHMIPIQQPLFLVIKVAFPNLEELRLEWNDIMKEIWHSQFSLVYCHKLKVLKLIGFPKEFAIFPSCFLQELPNFEKLVVRNAFFKEIFPCERIYDEEKEAGMTLARLGELKLSELPDLMHLWKEGVQGGPAFENLGTLEVSKCDSIKILVPSSISFQNLTILEVSKCHGLINLVTLSTARSLVQLSRMIITECELMTEVIPNEGSEAKDEIAFNQLKYLGLHCLPSLTSFCSGNYTFEFPSLEDVIVNQCLKLQIFSQGVSTPKLQRVQLTEEGDKEQWEGNLNSTIQHLFNKMNVMIAEED